ncbi:hypothetical protein B7494_g6910 [Chlorociboria aeruginascens]|nr:hypothetical protein B7494_g6910 [Chlorociboria aeruginascens]
MQAPDKSGSLMSPIGFSYYASATSLDPTFYQSLLDRGWRRSGTLLYKPDLRASCCPQYTLRLDSQSFHASKGQRQAINRFNKYILGDKYSREAARLHPRSREQARKRDIEFDLSERVHEAEDERLKTPPSPEHTFTITLEPSEFTEEKYAIFENYQRIVHQEPPRRISQRGFRNFLCETPLLRSTSTINGHERRLGSYHQCYRIDGELVAVGILDLLPECVSAVYFMYHESVHSYGFGKLGALREIALAQEEGYRWWYAGFYIPSCVKMRYKESKAGIAIGSTATTEDLLNVDQTSSEPSNPDSDSDDDEPPVPNPSLPIFSRGMPGLMTKQQLLTDIDLDHIKIRIGDVEAETGELRTWHKEELENLASVVGLIAELISAIGPELGREVLVSFR